MTHLILKWLLIVLGSAVGIVFVLFLIGLIGLLIAYATDHH